MAQLGSNALGEVLEPGRVPDCYLGLRLDPNDGGAVGVLLVAPAALLHPTVPQPDGTVLYELVIGHPDRAAHELVFMPDLTRELRAWPYGTWASLGVDVQAAAGAVIAAWHKGHFKGLQLGGLTAEEALALERPAMTYVREQLRPRLAHQVGQAYWRWPHPPADAGRRPLSVAADTAGCGSIRGRTPAVRTGHQPSGQLHGRSSGSTADTAAESGSSEADTAAAVWTAAVGGPRQQPGQACPDAPAVRASGRLPRLGVLACSG